MALRFTSDGSAGPTEAGGFKAEAGRYHLYLALICRRASRRLIGRKLKKLEVCFPCLAGWLALRSSGLYMPDFRPEVLLHDVNGDRPIRPTGLGPRPGRPDARPLAVCLGRLTT